MSSAIQYHLKCGSESEGSGMCQAPHQQAACQDKEALDFPELPQVITQERTS